MDNEENQFRNIGPLNKKQYLKNCNFVKYYF